MSSGPSALLEAVANALEHRSPLRIIGGDSKRDMLGRDIDPEATTLDVSGHRGIVDYSPGELVITARSGTPVAEIEAALAEQSQVLPFEPPLFSGKATLGGTLACNMSGPARPWGGSVRDTVLGVQLINGRAELLNFGGRVIKNVAGYDVSRLQCGALGTLGVITEVSLKVLPKPEQTITLRYELDAPAALGLMHERASQPKPLSGACWVDGCLYLRLQGAERAVSQTARNWGGESVADGNSFWRKLREFRHPFFAGADPLWRFSIRPTSPPISLPGVTLIDWGGAQRWIRGDHSLAELESLAESSGGHACIFRGGNRRGEVNHRQGPVRQELHRRLKRAFDPRGIFNPGRLYSWM